MIILVLDHIFSPHGKDRDYDYVGHIFLAWHRMGCVIEVVVMTMPVLFLVLSAWPV